MFDRVGVACVRQRKVKADKSWIGATPEGKKELVGLTDGVRESKRSWNELLLDLKRSGLSMGPELADADGALGFWEDRERGWHTPLWQRCCAHKTSNVLNNLPKSQQSRRSGRCKRSGWPKPRRMRCSHLMPSSKPGASVRPGNRGFDQGSRRTACLL